MSSCSGFLLPTLLAVADQPNAGAFIVGYVLWRLDFQSCRILRDLRHQLGMPFGFLLELHGWWHVLTAWSGATYIKCIHILDQCAMNEKRGAARSRVEEPWEKDDLV